MGADSSPFLLFAPAQMASFLDFYDSCIEPIAKDYNLISNNDIMLTPLTDSRATEVGLLSIQTCLVRHCMHAYGFALTIDPVAIDQAEPVKITYSGDTMPCRSLVELGDKSTVLIHEATMEDSLIDEARAKTHSTTSQALEQAQQMNAKYTLLTHFSQRYAKMPIIPEDLKNVGLAFDNMEIVMSDFAKLDLMHAPLKVLFSEELTDLTRKQVVRTLHKEYLKSQ